MKKNILVLIILTLFVNKSFSQYVAEEVRKSANMENTSDNKLQNIYGFKVEAISGKEFDLKSLAGKKVMIVNTASECGFTPQYAQLEQLYKEYGNQLTIIGFPTNDFGKQEPGSNEQIATFCQKNYGVTFPMMAKITVTGKTIHPLYKFLTNKSKNGFQDSKVEWNFQKYLIDEKGNLVKVLSSKVSPMDESILNWIATGQI